MMSHINKLLIIFVNLALAIGCSSNITKDVYKENLTISIEKPKITYSIDRLPKEINIFLLSTESTEEKEFLKGLTLNYYFFKNLIDYSPQINFVTKKILEENNCSINSNNINYSIILLNESFLNSLNQTCLNKLLKVEGLLIKNNIPKINQKGLTILNLDRKSEYKSLLAYGRSKGNINSLIIDNTNKQDSRILKEIWLSLGGKVIDSSSIGKSNQSLLSEILLIQRSKQRSRNLSRALSTPLESTPRRRMDIDSIILSVALEKARSFKPELEYNFGESLSVYLLPEWENEGYYLEKELDLENVLLIDLPWMLNPEIPYLDTLPDKRNRYFALGFDSYDIAVLLSNNKNLGNFNFIGMSGKLVYRNGKLLRKSLKAEIHEGSFKVIGF